MSGRCIPSSIGFSRRALLAVGAASLAAMAGGQVRIGGARADWDVLAIVAPDDGANLRSGPSVHRQKLATLAAGTTVRILAGPGDAGWYRIEPLDAVAGAGWIESETLAFVTRVRAVDGLSMLGLPGDWSTEFAWVRRGFVVTLIGPDLGDWILVRSGDRVGYVSAWSLARTDAAETDPGAEAWVDVDRSSSQVRLCIGETVVDRFDAQLSRDQDDGFYATAVGTYAVYQKIEGLTYTPFADAYFEYWAGFDPERFNGFHSWVMDADGEVIPGGDGPTAGCVATAPDAAAIIYDFVELGTRVEIHW